MKIKSPKVKEFKYSKDGKTYTSFQVVWSDRQGKRQRKQFTDRNEAAMFASETHTHLLNDGTARRNLSTVLTEPLLREAEVCIGRLGGKYRLTECVDYFLRHFRDPEFKITIGDAVAKFQIAKEGVHRERSVEQFVRDLKRFEQFADNRNVHEVTTELVESFIHTFRAKDGVNKASRKTWNNVRTELHTFFAWCQKKPQRYIETNPATDVKRFKLDRGEPEILSVECCEEMMRYLETFKGGRLVRYFALALFAGIRPEGELEKLANKPGAVRLGNMTIGISADVAKTRKPRGVTIQPNLAKWLAKYDGPIKPVNVENDAQKIREKFGVGRDVLRHTFISMHSMAFGSFVETAIQSGNSESIIRQYYFNTVPKADALRFWNITPEGDDRKVVPFAQSA